MIGGMNLRIVSEDTLNCKPLVLNITDIGYSILNTVTLVWWHACGAVSSIAVLPYTINECDTIEDTGV